MKKTMRRVISVLLVLLLVMSMAVTAFAEETLSFMKTDPYTGEVSSEKYFSISAETVDRTDEVLIDYDFGSEFEVIECTGETTVTALDSNLMWFFVSPFYMDDLTYGKMFLPEGITSTQEWVDTYDKSGYSFTLSAPGVYGLEVGEKDGFYSQYVIKVEEGSAKPATLAPETAVPKSFSDIPASHWAHDAIMEMVTMGILKGATLPDANGIATFNAGGQMKYAEFLAVMTRMIYPDVDIDYAGFADEGWYMPFYYAALDMELVFEGEVTKAQLMQPMTREQMARVLTRTGMMIGTVSGEVGYTDFPDIHAVGDEYFESVAMAYGEGLLCGVDSKGTFNPKGTLTRAEAAMVCFRLLDYSARKLPA